MLAFIHINKTAGSTVRYILRSSFGLRHCDVEPWHAPWSDPPFSGSDLRRLRKLYRILESIAGHRVTGYANLEDDGTEIRYFTFMRDPLKTCASRFQFNVQFRKKTDLVFEDWIQQEWPRNAQTKRIAGTPDANMAIRIMHEKGIFVGLTDHFDESMIMLKELIAPSLNIAYRRVNVASSNSLAQSLLSTQRTRELLIDANKEDLALYDYVKEELYPAFRRQYGPSLNDAVANYRQIHGDDFNRQNLTLSRLKQHMLYKPLVYLNRRGIAVV